MGTPPLARILYHCPNTMWKPSESDPARAVVGVWVRLAVRVLTYGFPRDRQPSVTCSCSQVLRLSTFPSTRLARDALLNDYSAARTNASPQLTAMLLNVCIPIILELVKAALFHLIAQAASLGRSVEASSLRLNRANVARHHWPRYMSSHAGCLVGGHVMNSAYGSPATEWSQFTEYYSAASGTPELLAYFVRCRGVKARLGRSSRLQARDRVYRKRCVAADDVVSMLRPVRGQGIGWSTFEGHSSRHSPPPMQDVNIPVSIYGRWRGHLSYWLLPVFVVARGRAVNMRSDENNGRAYME
ncbi:hypothetical protein FKP32DRAFT_69298 [Trametes sanguinea]|nr:hypothetical protein FKP32DRAFT_69298 [Trametes sanguinea]